MARAARMAEEVDALRNACENRLRAGGKMVDERHSWEASACWKKFREDHQRTEKTDRQ